MTDRKNALSPCVDIIEGETGVIVKADMPGVGQDGVEVELERGVLTVRGARNGGQAGPAPSRSEFRADCIYERSFVIGDEIDRDGVKAAIKDGVLTVTLPKTGRASRRIAVRSE